MMIEGSGSGSILLTSESGSGRPKNMWIRLRIRNTALNYSSVCVHFFLQKDTKNTKYQLGKLIYSCMEEQGNPCMPEGGLMSNGSGRGRRLRQPQPCEYCGLRGRALCSRCKVKSEIILLATSLDFRSGNSYPAVSRIRNMALKTFTQCTDPRIRIRFKMSRIRNIA
jgi:hypothetical protein